jgi:RIO kinase 1
VTGRAGTLLFDCVFPSSSLANHRASPRLKDAQIPPSSCTPLYTTLILILRTLFHSCKLVHADLSEYNILYHNSELYIIDVSQSVEHDHPSAFDFLRNDIKNVDEFWGRMGVKTLGVRRCFEFVTKELLDGDVQEVLQKWLQEDVIEDKSEEEGSLRRAHEDSVFLQSYIPRTLNEVYDPERDVAAINRGEGKGLIYADTIGLVESHLSTSKVESAKATVHFEDEGNGEDGNSDSEEREGDEDPDDSESGKDNYEERKPRGHRHEDRDAKKVRIPLI